MSWKCKLRGHAHREACWAPSHTGRYAVILRCPRCGDEILYNPGIVLAFILDNLEAFRARPEQTNSD